MWNENFSVVQLTTHITSHHFTSLHFTSLHITSPQLTAWSLMTFYIALEATVYQFCADQRVKMKSDEISAQILSPSNSNQTCTITISSLPDITLIEFYGSIKESFVLVGEERNLVSVGRYLHVTGSSLSQYQMLYRKSTLHLVSHQRVKPFNVTIKSTCRPIHH